MRILFLFFYRFLPLRVRLAGLEVELDELMVAVVAVETVLIPRSRVFFLGKYFGKIASNQQEDICAKPITRNPKSKLKKFQRFIHQIKINSLFTKPPSSNPCRISRFECCLFTQVNVSSHCHACHSITQRRANQSKSRH